MFSLNQQKRIILSWSSPCSYQVAPKNAALYEPTIVWCFQYSGFRQYMDAGSYLGEIIVCTFKSFHSGNLIKAFNAVILLAKG